MVTMDHCNMIYYRFCPCDSKNSRSVVCIKSIQWFESVTRQPHVPRTSEDSKCNCFFPTHEALSENISDETALKSWMPHNEKKHMLNSNCYKLHNYTTILDFSFSFSFSKTLCGTGQPIFSCILSPLPWIRCCENFKDDVKQGFCSQRFGNLYLGDQESATHYKDGEKCSSTDSESHRGFRNAIMTMKHQLRHPYLEDGFTS